MDDTGMTDADKVGLVEDVLAIPGVRTRPGSLPSGMGSIWRCSGKRQPPTANLQPSTSKVHALSLERRSRPQEAWKS